MAQVPALAGQRADGQRTRLQRRARDTTLFEGEDDQHLAHVTLDLRDALRPPRPELRADIVDDGNAAPVKLARQAEVPVGKVDEHGGVRFAGIHRAQQFAEFAPDFRQSGDDLSQADHRDVLGVHDQTTAGAAHAFAAHAEAVQRWLTFFQGGDQQRAVVFAGSFPGRDQQSHGNSAEYRSRAQCATIHDFR